MYDPSKPYKKEILKLIESTWITNHVSVFRGIYPIFRKNFYYPEIQHTDGIGTKGIFHWKNRSFKAAAIDALAMNLNDLLLARATPYSLQNHIVIPEDDHGAILEIIGALAEECKKYGIAMTGGETSVQDKSSFDISVTLCGFIPDVRPNRFEIGDALLGLPSSGLHSNGFSLVRELLGEELRDEFVMPTKIYFKEVSKLPAGKINGLMHVTGGAFTKLRDILPKDADVVIENPLKPHDIFYELYKKGISDKEMHCALNCGTGFVLSVPKSEAGEITSVLKNSAIIGEVVPGKGMIIIKSPFSGNSIIL